MSGRDLPTARHRQPGHVFESNTAGQRLFSVYRASTCSSSTSALCGAPQTRPATHHSAPGRPADAYARDPGSCFSYDARRRAMTSPCAGSHSRTEPASSVPSTTASYHLHTTTSVPSGPVAIATRWPGDTRSTRGEGNIAANLAKPTSPWLQIVQACSSARITRAVRRRCGAKTASGCGMDMCPSLTGVTTRSETIRTPSAPHPTTIAPICRRARSSGLVARGSGKDSRRGRRCTVGEQVKFPPFPGDRDPSSGNTLPDLPSDRCLPAGQPQRGPDRALPPGPSRSTRFLCPVAGSPDQYHVPVCAASRAARAPSMNSGWP